MLPDYALAEAIKRGSIEGMNEALSRGASITAIIDKKTMLEIAQDSEQPECARYLIKLGSDLDQRVGKQGDTILHRSVKRGDYGFTSLLLDEGCNKSLTNNAGRKPIDYATGYMKTRLGR